MGKSGHSAAEALLALSKPCKFGLAWRESSATRTTDTQRELFFKNSKLLGFGRQIGLKFFEAFGVFSAKLLALFWHCESLVHEKM